MAERKEKHRFLDVFKNSCYRMKKRDTQAAVLTAKNADQIANACRGMVIRAAVTRDSKMEREEPIAMVRFEGLHGTVFAVEGEVVVRTLMPGEEYFSVMKPEQFEKIYERVSWTEMYKKESA